MFGGHIFICVCVTLSTSKYQFLVCVLPILIFLAYSLVSYHYLYFSFDFFASLWNCDGFVFAAPFAIQYWPNSPHLFEYAQWWTFFFIQKKRKKRNERHNNITHKMRFLSSPCGFISLFHFILLWIAWIDRPKWLYSVRSTCLCMPFCVSCAVLLLLVIVSPIVSVVRVPVLTRRQSSRKLPFPFKRW